MGMKVMAFAGVITMLQAVTQAILSSLSLAQYFCLIDFLRDLPFLIYIKILYLHNPDCGSRINIGKVIEGIPDQAFVLLTNEPLTVTRTFYINSASLGLSVLWFLASIILMAGKEKSGYFRPLRWPWVFISIAVCGCDVVATVIFANDSFYTRTLTEMMDYIGGTISGIGNKQLDTSLTAWIMVALYSRFAIFFVINLILIVIVVLDKSKPKPDISAVESPTVSSPPPPPPPPPLQPPQPPLPQIAQSQTPKPQVDIPVHLPIRRVSEPIVARKVSNNADDKTVLSIPLSNITEASTSTKDMEDSSIREDSSKIPRAGFSNAFRTMKRFLFTKPSTSQRASMLDSSYTSPEGSPKLHHREIDKKRTINFPENLLSLPQRLENMIAEQQRRLDNAVIDTARSSTPRASQSLPQLNDSQDGNPALNRGRRDTAAELQGQLPWAYIPASAHRMRDQLPPDEDLPPVPLPDYTALHSVRKASVHRAASSLSSLTQKRNYISQLPRLSPLTQSDVLY